MAGQWTQTGRKGVYYLGMCLMVLGFLVFGSLFLSLSKPSGPRDMDAARGRTRGQLLMTRAMVGMGLVIAGALMQATGLGGRAADGDGDRGVPTADAGDGKPTLDEYERRLRELHRLHADGAISDAEYDREKAAILSQF